MAAAAQNLQVQHDKNLQVQQRPMRARGPALQAAAEPQDCGAAEPSAELGHAGAAPRAAKVEKDDDDDRFDFKLKRKKPQANEANLEARLEANLEALKPEAEARGRKLLPNEAREQEENTPRGEQVAPPESVMDLDRLLSALVTCGVRSEAQVDELTDALARGETSEQELIETWGLAVAICGPPPSEPAAVSALESALWHPTCPGAPVRSTRRARVLYLEAALLPSSPREV